MYTVLLYIYSTGRACPISVSVFFTRYILFPESTRQRAYSLVAQAYTSITAEDFAAFVGYSVEEAVKGKQAFLLRSRRVNFFNQNQHFYYFASFYFLPKGVVSQGWQADPNTRMVMPKKPGRWQCCSANCLPQPVTIRNPPPLTLSFGFYWTR